MTTSTLRLLFLGLLVALVLVVGGCGSSGGTPPPDTGEEDPPTPPGEDPIDGAVLYADAACFACHGADGTGGDAVEIACYSQDGLAVYVGNADSPHNGGTKPDWTDAHFAALAEFLGGGTCTSQVPASHTIPMNGILHGAGLGDGDSSCTPCHGPSLEGVGSIPSCTLCHGAGGSTACTGCHASAQDNGDGTPLLGRRAVMGEFTRTSHHVADSVTNDDCRICHDMSAHKQGKVRLRDVDDPATVVVLEGDPLTTAVEAVKLEPFCLACHDADGADGAAPFASGVPAPVIDPTAWAAASHHVAERTCLGDGETFGCHGTGHGSTKRKMLGPASGSAYGVTGDTTREEEGFCYTCHTADGVASTDIEAAFGRTTHHIIGSHEQGTTIALECSSCHNPHLAASSSLLVDPAQGTAWAGTLQAHCLTCHDGSPPTGVLFPSTSTGTGFDKSAFVGTTHASELGVDSCLDCHLPHGSANRALLQGQYIVANSNEHTTGDYAACWECHSSNTILNLDDAFDEYHKKHVIDEDITCAACHDVHKGYDSGEVGLIDFSYAFDHSWQITLPGSQTMSSSFQFNSSTGVGTCSIICHGESHMNDDYGGD